MLADTALSSIDLSKFVTTNVTSIQAAFKKNPNLTTVNISSWNTAKVTVMVGVFALDSKLKTVYVGSNWSTSAVTTSNDMFNSCTSIVGGNGTTFNSSYTDKTYARIDTSSQKGYLTKKS
jgi:surface protein